MRLSVGAVLGGLCLTCAAAAAPVNHAAFGPWGVDLTGMDTNVAPGNDFFLYVNGAWCAKAVIPPERLGIGAFLDLRNLSETRLKDIAQEIEAKPYEQLLPNERQLRDLYDAYTDTKGIDARGLAPAAADLAGISALETHDDVARAMSSPKEFAFSHFQSARWTYGLFATRIEPDPKNSHAYMIHVLQSGLGLPNRDYYLREDAAIAATRDA